MEGPPAEVVSWQLAQAVRARRRYKSILAVFLETWKLRTRLKRLVPEWMTSYELQKIITLFIQYSWLRSKKIGDSIHLWDALVTSRHLLHFCYFRR
jgi:hypothetical protein